MKKLIIAFLFSICFFNMKAQENLQITLPETYELTNIILALTEYGQSDPYEVMKETQYYKNMLEYFEPVKNHPLLDSVNYSRERWEDYLAFRTDGFAFSFDEDGKITRKFEFYSVQGHTPLDNHLELVNDFIEKSGFRQFFHSNKEFYDYLVDNYKKYYLVNEMEEFLNEKIGKQADSSPDKLYLIVLSPLVHRMNCHRNIDNIMEMNFTSASPKFIDAIQEDSDMITRIVESHFLFTEMDHGYINPISAKYADLINKNFNNAIWDSGSGYPGINCFNEYMTWAVYDLFIKERYPEFNTDSIAIQWQYQNSERGFFAQNLFADKLCELYFHNEFDTFEEIYKPLLEWCKSVENKVTLPKLIKDKSNNPLSVKNGHIELVFSEPMKPGISFGIGIRKMDKSGNLEGKRTNIIIEDAQYSEDGMRIEFTLNSPFDDYVIFLNWWGHDKPLISGNGVFLQSLSSIKLKKES